MRGRADMNGLIRLPYMQRIGIRIRIDRDSGDAHLLRGLDDTAGDLAAIGDEDFRNHRAATSEGIPRMPISMPLTLISSPISGQ